MGSAVDEPQLVSELAYTDVAARELDAVTTGNTLKWGVVQPVDPEHWDFTQADAIVAFALAHHQAIKGHTLVWHEQLPPFVDASTPPDLLRRYLRRNIHEEVGRYRGRLHAWDVVNEAIADDGSGLRDTVFSEKLGNDYVAWAFAEAHAVDPHARLYYNDYGTETVNPKSNAVLALVAGLLAAGVPIDGVGFQMHLDAATAPSTEDMVANLERFTALGLRVNISELDVRIASLTSSEPEKLAQQKQVFHRAVAACLQVPGCDAVTTWGFTDKYSWLAPDEALWLDTQYQRKPAYYGLVDGFAGIVPDPIGTAPNLIANATFESGLDGWTASGGTLSAPATRRGSHTGARSALVADRVLPADGPAVDITHLLTPGHGYDASAWARIAGAATDQVTLGARISCPSVPDVVLDLRAVTASDASWAQLTGSLQVPNCPLTSASLYLAGPQPGIALRVDDVALRPQPEPRGPNLVANPGFETGDTSGWVTWGATILATTAAAHGGTTSAIVSDRTATWQGPVVPLTAAVTPGATYAAGAWVRIDGTASDSVSLTLKSTCGDGDPVYQQIAAGTASDAAWVQLAGTFLVPVCVITELDVYVEGPAPGVDVLVDDVAVEQLLWHEVATSVIASSDFESGGAGWSAFGGSFSVSSAFAHGGTQSGESSDRTATWNGPSYSLPPSPATFDVSAWALQNGTEDLGLQLTAKVTCGGADSYLSVAGATTAAPATWVQLQGQLAVPAGCTSVMLYLEQASGTVFPDLYIDDVSATLIP
jgi:GH35 family endo-1,4-beta-xylanase